MEAVITSLVQTVYQSGSKIVHVEEHEKLNKEMVNELVNHSKTGVIVRQRDHTHTIQIEESKRTRCTVKEVTR